MYERSAGNVNSGYSADHLIYIGNVKSGQKKTVLNRRTWPVQPDSRTVEDLR